MFYCDACADEHGYPQTLGKSYGNCECCGMQRRCNDRPSSLLRAPKAIQQQAAEALELGEALVADMREVIRQAQILITGWKARDFLDHHKENLCIPCAQAALFSTGVNASLEQAQEMMCYQVKVAVAQILEAREAVEWFK